VTAAADSTPGSLRVAILRRPCLHREHVRGVEAERNVAERREASHQQAGAHEQGERQPGLGDDERRAQPAATRRQCARAALQGLAERAQAHRQHGGRCGRSHGDERRDQREAERGRVERGVAEPRHVLRRERHQQRNASKGAEHAEPSAQEAEDQALGQDPARELRVTRAERRAERHLGPPLAHLHELQRGDVGAGHQQDEADPAEESEQRRAGRAEHSFGERRDDCRDPFRLVGLAVVGRGERGHVAPCLCERDERRPKLGARGMGEAFRHHAHDREGLLVQRERAAHHGRVRPEAVAPERVTQHHHAGGSPPVVLGEEGATERGRDAEH